MKYRIFKPLIFIAILAAASALVMLLWNWIIPQVIGWQEVSYLQAAGLFVLCRLLFGGFGGFIKEQKFKCNKNIRSQVRGMNKQEKREYIREYINGNREQ